jgi:hypothetical protein
MHHRLFMYLLAASLTLITHPVPAQVSAGRPARVRADLGQVTRQAGMILAGRIVSIEPQRTPVSGQVNCVQITVHVEQGIRGARTGDVTSFREWAGLWSGGARYRVGQRLVLFLYPPSSLGFTSPVGGTAGQLAIDRSGSVFLTSAQQQAIGVATHEDSNRMIPVEDFARALRRLQENEP